MRLVVLTICCALLVLASSSAIADRVETVGAGDDGLPGIFRVHSPVALHPGFAAGVASGYGFSGSVLDADDSHHRASTRLGLAYALRSWLGVALRFDGRYDKHYSQALGEDDGILIDSRLVVRARRRLAPSWSLGGQLTLWNPGQEAVANMLDALSPELVAALAYRRPDHSLSLAANLGFRMDRSEATVENPDRLTPADRLALGLSENDALIVGLGASYDLLSVQLLGEWNMDLGVGKGAPKFRESPMRASLGARYPISSSLALQIQLQARVSRVALPADATQLFPFEPAAQIVSGLHYRFGGETLAPAALVVTTPQESPEPEPLPSFDLSVDVVAGARRIDDAKLELRGVVAEAIAAQAKGGGVYVFDALPAGEYQLRASAEGYRAELKSLTIPVAEQPVHIKLVRALPPGQLRGAVRSYRSKGLQASVRIAGIATAADDTPQSFTLVTELRGSFSIDLPPGAYEVTVEAPSYKSQTRKVKIDEDGVTILNVDLRK